MSNQWPYWFLLSLITISLIANAAPAQAYAYCIVQKNPEQGKTCKVCFTQFGMIAQQRCSKK